MSTTSFLDYSFPYTRQEKFFEAGFESRREFKDAEWMLNPKIFNKAQKILSFQLQVDCFANRINPQLHVYFSRRPDTEAKFIDAFTVNWRPYLCYLFLPFTLLPRAKDSSGASTRSNCSTLLANPVLVQSNFELSSTRNSDLQTQCNQFDITTRSKSQTPISRKTFAYGGSIIWEKYRKLGYSENTKNILLASWRPGTLKNYSKYIDLWKQFASMNNFRVQNVLDFLSKLFSDRHSCSQIDTASSALSGFITINKVPRGKHPVVKRFMKGMFELRPTFPKYHTIWDVRKVFNYFKTLPVMSNLTLKELSLN